MPRSFADVLADLRRGACVDELTEVYRQVVDAVVDHGKKGSVTLTLSIEPQSKVDSLHLLVVDKVSAKIPEADRTGSIFYAENDGSLVRHDPNQARMDLREVPPDEREPIELKEVT